jgi:terminase large subunit-like protein
MTDPSILEAIDSIWQPWFRDRDSWSPWMTFLRGVFDLPMDAADKELFERHTGRTVGLSGGFREVWVRVGRRSGKSLIAATIAVFLACFRDWSDWIVPGESAVILVLASDRRQAKVIFKYRKAMLQHVPELRRMITRGTEEILELSNGISLEIATNSYRRVRGYSVIAGICDEIAFWQSDESANPDKEVLHALRPAMGARGLLYCLSSPHARSGALYESDIDNWGKNESKVLIWRATTREMHASFPQEIIDEALLRDPSAAAAEYLAEYRSDIESFISREVVDALVVPGRFELPPARRSYRAWVDPSGGSGDSMTLAISHSERAAGDSADIGVIDLVREVRPPFSPDSVAVDFCDILKLYRILSVTGDRYAGEWCRDRFRNNGISYEVSERSASDIYQEALPLLMARRCELLDNPRLSMQLQQLERRSGRTGKMTISHRPGGHDDIANAVCGALVLAASGHDWLDIWMRCAGSSKEKLLRGEKTPMPTPPYRLPTVFQLR